MFIYDGKAYITDKEASQRYPFSQSWFQKARMKKEGPPFIRLKIGYGKVFYSIKEIERWFKENLI